MNDKSVNNEKTYSYQSVSVIRINKKKFYEKILLILSLLHGMARPLKFVAHETTRKTNNTRKTKNKTAKVIKLTAMN